MASKKSENAPLIEFTVSMPRPSSHNFKVTAKVSGDEGGEFKVAFAAWTPGSYKIRDFARNVSDFGAAKGAKFELLDKQSYRLTGAGMVEFSYTLYADELSVRTPHLDDTHGFFLGSNLFPYLVGEDGKPAPCRYRITVVPYGDWKVATSLEPVRGVANCWQAPDYDILADTPFEIGTHSIHSFTAFGVKHRVAFYGWGNFDEKRIVADTEKVVNKIAAAFGGVPYSSYLFINHFTPDSGGGLEHLNSCVCAWPSFKNVKEDDYQRFIRLVSHEYFHVFNVKRIRPEILGPFDYSKEQHTKALWVMEGLTQYYERLWCARAGVTPAETLLDSYSELFEREDARPGRKRMSLEDSSWLAWTKLYQADENFANSAISYYSRGAQIGFLLDAKIRKLTGGKKSLDDVLRLALKRYGYPKPGFAERGFEKMCEEVTGKSLSAFWRAHVRGTRELDYAEALDLYGLKLERTAEGDTPWLGFGTGVKDGRFEISHVLDDSPAAAAGLQARDEVLAVNHFKVTADDFDNRSNELRPGVTAIVTVFRRGRLIDHKVKVGKRPAGRLKLRPKKTQTAAQMKNYRRWLGR